MSERTFEPTGRRLEELRKRGDVALSPDLTGAATLFLAVSLLASRMPAIAADLAGLMRRAFTGLATIELTPGNVQDAALATLGGIGGPWLPFLLTLLGCGVIVTLMQTRGLIATDRIRPDFTRLNPFTGLKRLFSPQGLMETAKGLVKMAVLAVVLYSAVRGAPERLTAAALAGIRPAIDELARTVATVARQAAIVLVLIGGLDYVIKLRQHRQRTMMTREEVTEDMKNAEGHPMLKARIRELQRRMSRRRMMQQIAYADVVVTNPTHLAIALRYESKKMPAPLVIAKGQDLVAAEIVRRAKEHGVPVVQNIPLAHALIKVELNRPVPVTLYQAVAQVLAFVYRVRRNRAAYGARGAAR